MDIITKQDAIARGLNYYFTGKPCIKGHIAKRLISSPHCMECKRNKRKKYYADNIDEQRAKARKNHYDNREQRLKDMLEWQRNNREKVYARNNSWRAANKNKVAASNKQWRENNKAYILARNAARKKHVRIATPKWADMNKIKAIYADAIAKTAATNIQYHVDHIVPLRGDNVCGLHVENNLQVITAVENLKKNNRISSNVLTSRGKYD